MNGGMKVGLGRPGSSSAVLRVLPESVRNIRNIRKYQDKTQSNQGVTSENLFRQEWNTPEPSGTELFTHVLEMFRFPIFRKNRYSPSATRATEKLPKSVFRYVPPTPEHFQTAEARAVRGFQLSVTSAVPDVPDVSRGYAEFSFFPPACALLAGGRP